MKLALGFALPNRAHQRSRQPNLMLEHAYSADGDTGSASMYSGGAIKTPPGYVDTALAHELVPLQSVIV